MKRKKFPKFIVAGCAAGVLLLIVILGLLVWVLTGGTNSSSSRGGNGTAESIPDVIKEKTPRDEIPYSGGNAPMKDNKIKRYGVRIAGWLETIAYFQGVLNPMTAGETAKFWDYLKPTPVLFMQ